MKHALLLFCVLQGDPPPAPQSEANAFTQRVNEAITKGVEWLKKAPLPKDKNSVQPGTGGYGQAGMVYDSRLGWTSFMMTALLKSEVAHDDPVIKAGFKFIYEYGGTKNAIVSNYDRAAVLMAHEALYQAIEAANLKKRGQIPTERVGDFKEPKYSLSSSHLQFCSQMMNGILAEQTKEGGWRYGKPFGVVGSTEDVSATHIMLLGLKSASRLKMSVPHAAIKKALEFTVGMQEKDGPKVARPVDYTPGDRDTYASMGEDRARGWPYIKKGSKPEEEAVTGSMTCAGIACLIIGKSMIGKDLSKKLNDQIDAGIFDGFAWLLTNWTVEQNPKAATYFYYYLYGLERVGTLGRYEKIGNHRWYSEGAEVFLKAQKPNGQWSSTPDLPAGQIVDLVDTCYALLFLRRGTIQVEDVLTRTGSGEPAPPKEPPEK